MKKQKFILFMALCLFSSCATLQKLKHKSNEHTAAQTDTKKESEGSKHSDSLSVSETATIGATTTTTTIDTNINVPGETVAGEVAAPAAGETVSFTDASGTTEITNDGKGGLKVKTTTKAKTVPVKQSRTETAITATSSKTKTQERTDERTKATERTKVDSSAHRQLVTTDKTVKRPSNWIWAAALIVLILASIIYFCRK